MKQEIYDRQFLWSAFLMICLLFIWMPKAHYQESSTQVYILKSTAGFFCLWGSQQGCHLYSENTREKFSRITSDSPALLWAPPLPRPGFSELTWKEKKLTQPDLYVHIHLKNEWIAIISTMGPNYEEYPKFPNKPKMPCCKQRLRQIREGGVIQLFQHSQPS